MVWGNKSINDVNFNCFFGENGLFKNISKFTNEISVSCPVFNYQLHRMELFIVNCLILKIEAIQERLQLHDAAERILNKISYHNFYLLLIIIIILLILFVIYFIIKKLDWNKLIFRRSINEN